jgi:hypothetical protein
VSNPFTVTFPWLPGDPDRDAAAAVVIGRWREHHPDTDILTSADLVPPGTPWCKADHVRQLVQAADTDTVVISDVDVWVDPTAVLGAVHAVSSGSYAWAVPHADVHRLTADGTKRYLAGEELRFADYDQPPYRGWLAGGIYAINRQVALDIPMDPRFIGWGQEDESFAMALKTLVGTPWRGSTPLYHFWHSPMPRRDRAVGSEASEALCERYREASGNPIAMRQLVDEIKGLLPQDGGSSSC